MQKSISIIIPMFNEEKRILKTVQILNDYLHYHPGDEVIFVDDGSLDNTIMKVVNNVVFPNRMRVLCHFNNRGKWAALKTGFLDARKEYVAFLDADLSVDPGKLDDFRGILAKNKLIIGNRYGEFSSEYPLGRRFVSGVFNVLARIIVDIKVSDSQVPFKILNRQRFHKIMSSLKETGFAGDIELIKRAMNARIAILEGDVIYDYAEGSTINVRKHAWSMFRALWRIRRIA